MRKPKVIRCGQKAQASSLLTAKQVETLQKYWEYEEQLGLRDKPQDEILKLIPTIKRAKP